MPQEVINNPQIEITDKPILAWTVHLVRQSPQKLAWIVPLFLVSFFCGLNLMGPLGGVVVVVAMVTTLADFLFPVYYQLTPERASCKRRFGVTEICWKNVKRYYLDDFGIKLSPLAKLTRLEAYRGVYLRFDNDNKEKIIETVKSLRDTHV